MYIVYACKWSWVAQSSTLFLQLCHLSFPPSSLTEEWFYCCHQGCHQPNTRLDSVQHSLHLSCASHDILTEWYLNNAKKSRTIWCHSHEAGVRGYWFCNLILITLSTFHPYQPWISAPHLKQLPFIWGSFTKSCLFPLAQSFLQLWQDPLNMEINIMNIISNGSWLRSLPKNRDILKKIQILRIFYRVSLGTLTNSGALGKFSTRK